MTAVQKPHPPTVTISEKVHASCCEEMKTARMKGIVMLFGVDILNVTRVTNEACKYYLTLYPRELDYTYERALAYCPWCAAKL